MAHGKRVTHSGTINAYFYNLRDDEKCVQFREPAFERVFVDVNAISFELVEVGIPK